MLKLVKEIQILGVEIPMYIDEDGVELYLLTTISKKILNSTNTSMLTSMLSTPPVCRNINVDDIRRGTSRLYINKNQMMEIVTRSRLIPIKVKKEILTNLCGLSVSDVVLIQVPEIEFLEMLEQSIIGAFGVQKIIKQYKVGCYRLDAYLPDFNAAIEYDESKHEGAAATIIDAKRQSIIEKELGCQFIRVSIKNPHLINIGYVIKQLALLKQSQQRI